ncbi:MAG: hypothetical protein OXI43_12485 [Candidatus Poribacteria bacterium]|nr:hypothetical protein [Candidatus Poribacteria bacterium]
MREPAFLTVPTRIHAAAHIKGGSSNVWATFKHQSIGKEANKVLDVPNTLDNPPTPLFPIPRQLPTCPCQDDVARLLFYQVEETGNSYQIRIICVFCLQKGKQQIAWGPIGEEIVTYIFTRHFYEK